MKRMWSKKQIEEIVKNLAEGKELPLPNVYVVNDVKTLSNKDIAQLRAGDIVVKQDASGNHPYMVSFRSETGICLTYCDASCVETQSYDLIGGEWTYNSEDLSPINELEAIKDKDGHSRFIEGDITIKTITGVTKKYGKWSLSGTHLLIVLALEVVDTTNIASNTILAELDLPQWIKDKVVVMYTGISYIETKNIVLYGAGWSGQNITVSLRKPSNSTMDLRFESSLTLTADRSCRISFDLLIDNE